MMLSRSKSIWDRSFGTGFVGIAEAIAGDLPQHGQQRLQRQHLQAQPPTAATLAREDHPVQPHPDVAQPQRHRHQEQPHPRRARTRPRPRLVQLPVAGLDAEPLAVQFADPTRRRRLPAPLGVDQALAAMLAASPAPVAAVDADPYGGRAALWSCQTVLAEAAALPVGEHTGPARPLGVIGLPSPQRHRHQERSPRRLQVAQHADRVKPAVQQQQRGSHAGLAGRAQPALQHVGQVFALADVAEGHGHALAALDQVSGGVGVEVRRAALDLAAVEFVGVLVGLAVVGQQREIDGQPLAAATQLGQAGAQGPVAAPFQELAFRQIGQQRLADGLGRGRPPQAEGGREQRGQPGTGGEDDREQRLGWTGPAVVGQREVGAQQVGGLVMHRGRGEDIRHGTQASGQG